QGRQRVEGHQPSAGNPPLQEVQLVIQAISEEFVVTHRRGNGCPHGEYDFSRRMVSRVDRGDFLAIDHLAQIIQLHDRELLVSPTLMTSMLAISGFATDRDLPTAPLTAGASTAKSMTSGTSSTGVGRPVI